MAQSNLTTDPGAALRLACAYMANIVNQEADLLGRTDPEELFQGEFLQALTVRKAEFDARVHQDVRYVWDRALPLLKEARANLALADDALGEALADALGPSGFVALGGAETDPPAAGGQPALVVRWGQDRGAAGAWAAFGFGPAVAVGSVWFRTPAETPLYWVVGALLLVWTLSFAYMVAATAIGRRELCISGAILCRRTIPLPTLSTRLNVKNIAALVIGRFATTSTLESSHRGRATRVGALCGRRLRWLYGPRQIGSDAAWALLELLKRRLRAAGWRGRLEFIPPP